MLTYKRFGKKNNPIGFGKVRIGGGGVRATLTEEGKKYLVNNENSSRSTNYVYLKQAKLEFHKITEIREIEEMNVATVDYNIKRTNITPF